MDVQRTLLIGVMAVLTFMLLTEWVNFKEERVIASQATAPAATAPALPDAPTVPSAPVADDSLPSPELAAAADAAREDVPSVETPAASTAAVAASAGERITVTILPFSSWRRSRICCPNSTLISRYRHLNFILKTKR